MNLLATLAIFVLVLETVSSTLDRIVLHSDLPYAPLALIKKSNSRLELAIPQKSLDSWDYACYLHEESEDENGSVEKFLFACPARSYSDERFIEEKWKESNNMPENSQLFILRTPSSYSNTCSANFIPSIEKAQMKNENGDVEYCGDSEAEIYNVGFPVSNVEGTDLQFVSTYKICHSTAEGKGTLYSFHRIASPSLLLREAWDYYKPNTRRLNECLLDKSDSSEQMFYEKQYAYQFVGTEDMPTMVWGSTTRFSFNYTPITLNQDAMKGIIAVDNYIRLYSKETNKPLTLYSGIYKTTVNKPLISCAPALCSKATPLNAFWRIIQDDEGLATTIVTQHTKMECVEEDFICHGGGRVMVEEYNIGGCTYMCPVNKELIKRLGLPSNKIIERMEFPPLKMVGDLALTFPRKIRTHSTSSVEGKNDDGKLPEKVTIFEFFRNADFRSALKNADPYLAPTVDVHKQSAEDDDYYSHGSAPVYRPPEKSGKTGGGLLTFLGFGALSSGGGSWGGGGGGGDADVGGGGD